MNALQGPTSGTSRPLQLMFFYPLLPSFCSDVRYTGTRINDPRTGQRTRIGLAGHTHPFCMRWDTAILGNAVVRNTAQQSIPIDAWEQSPEIPAAVLHAIRLGVGFSILSFACMHDVGILQSITSPPVALSGGSMAYHVPPAIPRSARSTWLLLLWIGGLSSCLVGMYRLLRFWGHLGGTLRTIGDSFMMQQLGLAMILMLMILLGILAHATSWRGAWIGMLITTGLFMWQSVAISQHAARVIQRFPRFSAAWAEDGASLPWLLVGGSGVIILTCLLAIGSGMVVARTDRSSHNPIPTINTKDAGNDA